MRKVLYDLEIYQESVVAHFRRHMENLRNVRISDTLHENFTWFPGLPAHGYSLAREIQSFTCCLCYIIID